MYIYVYIYIYICIYVYMYIYIYISIQDVCSLLRCAAAVLAAPGILKSMPLSQTPRKSATVCQEDGRCNRALGALPFAPIEEHWKPVL